jgi:hypothetical protein
MKTRDLAIARAGVCSGPKSNVAFISVLMENDTDFIACLYGSHTGVPQQFQTPRRRKVRRFGAPANRESLVICVHTKTAVIPAPWREVLRWHRRHRLDLYKRFGESAAILHAPESSPKFRVGHALFDKSVRLV